MKNLQFVPVDKGVLPSDIRKQPDDKDLYVVELDVEPDSQVKRSMSFVKRAGETIVLITVFPIALADLQKDVV